MVSSKDIAKKAGVSQSTVSRVINNPEAVKKEKRDTVKKVMKELNYRPDSVARSLLSNNTNQISLISGTLNNPFFVESTQRIINIAYYNGFSVNVYFEEDFQHDTLYNNVFSQKTEGIILSSMYCNSLHFDELKNLGVPYIMFNRKHRNGGNFVELDNYQAGWLAGDYFISKGHSNIHWMGGELEKSTFHGRYTGFKDALQNHDIPVDAANFSITVQSPEVIEKEIERIISLPDSPTAIFATTDMIASIVLDVLNRKGLQVPRDIAIIGVDNTKALQHSAFNLTSIGIDENLGEIAIRHLIRMINEDKISEIQETLSCQLFERGTV
ncbi:LacI family DNA-binding transcriptional regulator [Salinicoccus albus]|uniref:LacI family DNA-binding transcriptional regulator n=1 Tax=Salinicoccus albus TaxID=418756 RepID=UPI000366D494|nr:LacI family DNA-binding transcriptional regulator [Salinicoccus albus]